MFQSSSCDLGSTFLIAVLAARAAFGGRLSAVGLTSFHFGFWIRGVCEGEEWRRDREPGVEQLRHKALRLLLSWKGPPTEPTQGSEDSSPARLPGYSSFRSAAWPRLLQHLLQLRNMLLSLCDLLRKHLRGVRVQTVYQRTPVLSTPQSELTNSTTWPHC